MQRPVEVRFIKTIMMELFPDRLLFELFKHFIGTRFLNIFSEEFTNNTLRYGTIAQHHK